MTPQAHSYELAKAFYMRALQVALRCATSLVARNQMQPVVMKALFDTQQQFSGCATVASSECFASSDPLFKSLRMVPIRSVQPYIILQPFCFEAAHEVWVVPSIKGALKMTSRHEISGCPRWSRLAGLDCFTFFRPEII